MSDEPLTHIAGPDLTVDGRRLRQRCIWCGAVIVDYDLERVAVPDGQDPTPATWKPGTFVRVSGTFPVAYVAVDPPEGGRYPPDSCMALDDEVTA